MEKELLESYRSKKSEIRELKYSLSTLGEGDQMIGNDVINDYRSGYPMPQAVVGVDWQKVARTEERYRSRIRKLEEECHQVEEFIESIPDSLTRRIFRMKYIEGMTQEKIGKKIHMERSSVSKKIDNFIKDSHNSQKAHL